ncbi:MAG: macro domain-containing protein [Nitrospiraceae bacterium]|nr:macro domain-containing protein [Nitrospiraceae bacterium]
MIKVLIGDLFTSKAQTLVNTVNCVGIMGKGIALQFKNRFPDMFKDYEERCKRKEVKLGRPYLYATMLPPHILNFPTKDHWRSVTNLADIEQGLEYLLKHYKEWGITSIAVPPLGCGEGQLEWRVVGPTLYRYLRRMDIPVELYAPYGTPHEELQLSFLESAGTPNASIAAMPEPRWIQPAWVALVEIIRLIEAQTYRHFIGRTIFQKIAYVATANGLPTGLKFEKKSYGPFSSDLKKVYARLMNNGLIEEESVNEKAFSVRVGKTYIDAIKAYKDKIEQWQGIINKTADLFLRLDSKQAEVVATVLYAAGELQAKPNGKPSEQEVLNAVQAWKLKRRPPLETQEIAQTIRNLGILSWLKLQYSEDLPIPEDELAHV